MSLGLRLRQYITVNGLSVRQFERLTGIPYRSLHEYMSEKRKPGADHLTRMADAGVDVDWLLTGKLRPGIFFDLSSMGDFPAIEGIVGGYESLHKYIVGESIKIVDEIIREQPDKFSRMGVSGIILSIWNVFSTYSKIVNDHSEDFEKARSVGFGEDKSFDILFSPLRAALKERLRDMPLRDPSA